MSPRLCQRILGMGTVALCAIATAQNDPYKPGVAPPNPNAPGSQGAVQSPANQPIQVNPNVAPPANRVPDQPAQPQLDPNTAANRDYDNTGFQDEVRAFQEREQAFNNAQPQQRRIENPGIIERDVRGPARYDVFPPSADDTYDLRGANAGTTTGTVVDPQTGAVIDRQTGAIVDPQTGVLIDPRTGAALDPQTAAEAARQRALAIRNDERLVNPPAVVDRPDRGPARYDVFPPSQDDRYDFSNQPSNLPTSPSDVNTAPETVNDPTASQVEMNRVNPHLQANRLNRFQTLPDQTESLEMGTPGVPDYDLTPNPADPRFRPIDPVDPNVTIPQPRAVPQEQFPTGFPYYNTSGQANPGSSATITRRNWKQENFNLSGNAGRADGRSANRGTAASRGASGSGAGSGSSSGGG